MIEGKSMLRKVLEKIKKENLITTGDKIVVGFSGGPDSVFLLEALLKLKEEIDFEIILAHINHLLRGEEADRDESFSREYAEKNNLKYYIKRISIEEEAKKLGIGLEETGREVRYSFFNEVLEIEKGNKIAVAHNLDDQVENFLFRLIRGCSLEGLEGIKDRENIIRPINEVYKKDIMEYLDRNNISYCIDRTNLENEFTRNSIRLDLIPFIENRYNKNFKDKIFNLMKEIREINSDLKIDLKNYFIKKDKKVLYSLEKVLNEKIFIRKKIINEIFKENKIKINREKIEKVVSILEKTGTKEYKLTKDKIIKKDYEYFWIEDENEKNRNKEFYIEVKVPFDIEVNGYRIITQESEKSFGNSEFLTNLKSGDKIIIRNRKAGDKIKPLGMENYKKVKDILINEKVPKDRREGLPILEKNSEIVWIPEIKKSEIFRKENGERGIKLIVRRQNER